MHREFKEIISSERITFLNEINRLLKKTSQEIIDRAIVCLETAEKKLRNKDSFTTHYFVEAQVNYFLGKSDHASYGYWDSFEYESTIVKKYYGLLLSKNDWYDPVGIWPELDEPYCYLMNDLLKHSKLYEKVFELNLIEVSIFYKDHKLIMIKPDGNSMHLKFDNQ